MAADGPTLLVLAAGLGSRFGGLKQCEPMGPNGETLLDYAVYDAHRAGFGRVVFVIREDMANAFSAGVDSRYGGKLRVDCVQQRLDDLPAGFSVPRGRVKPWGTLHAVLAARAAIHEPFAVINADDFYGQDAYLRVFGFFRTSSARPADQDHYCMVGYALSHTLSDTGGVNRGICVAKGGMLAAVEEHFDIIGRADGRCDGLNLRRERVEIAGKAVVSMNFWGFTPAIFKQMQQHLVAFLGERSNEPQAECLIPSVIDTLVRTGRADCRILPTEAHWFGVTHPLDKPQATRNILALIAAGTYPNVLWS